MSIEYTEDQQKIVDFLKAQINNPNGENVVISGAAGTGKSTMICQLIATLIEEGIRVAVTAMTGKATAILRNKIMQTIAERGVVIPSKGLIIQTVAKLTKESSVIGLTADGETIYTNTWKDPKAFAAEYDVLFIDELSMIPQYISKWWLASGIRTFGFGDECQLPEVSTADTKVEIANFKHDLKLPESKYVAGYGIKVLKDASQKQLHKVLRSDNEIALLCAELRDFTQSKNQFIGRIKSWAAKTENIKYSTSLKDLPPRGSDWQILAFTNKTCQRINEERCIGQGYPDALDKIILMDNLNPFKKYNGDIMLFSEFIRTIEQFGDNGRFYVCMKWNNKMPKKDSPNAYERKFFNNYVEFKRASKNIHSKRMRSLPMIVKSSGYAPGQIKTWLASIEDFKKEYEDPDECFVNILTAFQDDNIDLVRLIMKLAPPLPQLYMVSAGLGYCTTVHKSQGSEYKNTCYIMERFDKPLAYTGISRAREKLMVIDLTN